MKTKLVIIGLFFWLLVDVLIVFVLLQGRLRGINGIGRGVRSVYLAHGKPVNLGWTLADPTRGTVFLVGRIEAMHQEQQDIIAEANVGVPTRIPIVVASGRGIYTLTKLPSPEIFLAAKRPNIDSLSFERVMSAYRPLVGKDVLFDLATKPLPQPKTKTSTPWTTLFNQRVVCANRLEQVLGRNRISSSTEQTTLPICESFSLQTLVFGYE